MEEPMDKVLIKRQKLRQRYGPGGFADLIPRERILVLVLDFVEHPLDCLYLWFMRAIMRAKGSK